MINRDAWLFAGAGVVLAGAVWFFGWRTKSSGKLAQAESGYVNPATCDGCHSEISRSYRLTGMGRSLYRLSTGNIVEDFKTRNTLYSRVSDRYYTMIEREGKWYQRRHQVGFDGQPTNIAEKQIDYVVGSGNHSRSYLNRTAQGTLVELPVSWYAEKGGFWAMSPGYDRADQDDFRRTIVSRCLACHTAYPPLGQGLNLATSEPLFGDRIPEGIDCLRCHGPGRAHVEAAGSGSATPESIRAAIVNPARLNRDRQLEVCMQCHLETTHFALPNEILRDPQHPFSYRPGEPLGDFILFFDHAPGTGYDDKFEIVNAAYRLRKSACFQSSQMTCTTCHDAHSVQRPEEATAHYTAVCRNCHASAHASKMPTGANSCIECHMPRRRTEDVVHAVMTDHYIQRKRPSRDLVAPVEEAEFAAGANYHGEVTLYYPPTLPTTLENELNIDLAQVSGGANLKSGIPRLERDLEKYKPPGAELHVALGKAYKKAGNFDEAIHWYEEVLRSHADFRPALEELGDALIAAGRRAQATEVLEKAVALPLPNTGVLTNLGGAYFTQGNLDRARQVLDRALSLNPDLPEAHNFLGLVSLQQRDWSGAEKHFRHAVSIQPDYAAAQYNLATTLAGTARQLEAQFHFEKAIAAQPDYAEAHHHYGVLLAQIGAHRKALAELRESLRLNPNLAEAYSDLATALAAQGQIESAVDAFRHAIQMKPELYEAHLGLGRILTYKGDTSEARAHYEEAAKSPDPDVREAARNALR
jgi:predicted CXXCH cytochrome family protein